MIVGAIAIALSTILPYLVVALGVGAAWRFRFYGGGGAAINALEAANRVLEARVRALENENTERAKRISELEGRTDVALAIVPVLDALKSHEIEATKRSAAMIALLTQLTERVAHPGESIAIHPDGPIHVHTHGHHVEESDVE